MVVPVSRNGLAEDGSAYSISLNRRRVLVKWRISLCFADEIFIFEFLRVMVAVQVLAKKHRSSGCSGDVGIRISRLNPLSLR